MQHVLLSQAQDNSSSGKRRTELLSYSQSMEKVSILLLLLLCHLGRNPQGEAVLLQFISQPAWSA